mmetsp:Transcript_38818/g.85301  ORF Transcript_38818/g.85301 Transcript_38818/m.85301 type:complete len:217 (+) Transcript_38818:811-1461(+)
MLETGVLLLQAGAARVTGGEKALLCDAAVRVAHLDLDARIADALGGDGDGAAHDGALGGVEGERREDHEEPVTRAVDGGRDVERHARFYLDLLGAGVVARHGCYLVEQLGKVERCGLWAELIASLELGGAQALVHHRRQQLDRCRRATHELRQRHFSLVVHTSAGVVAIVEATKSAAVAAAAGASVAAGAASEGAGAAAPSTRAIIVPRTLRCWAQ